MTNTFLLLAEAAVYFGAMATLFRMRGHIGVGVFMSALGVMHFIETYLASVFYVMTPVGMLSPGSTILFSGKLVMLLLLYIKEDAVTVRQPIYGLLLGNAMMVGFVLILRFHELAPLPSGAVPDIGFIDDMGWLMVWGTALLYIDAILIILLYERLGALMRHHQLLRVLISTAAVLTIDQVGFFTALYFVADAPFAVFFGGWAGKMAAAATYSLMLVAYLRFVEDGRVEAPRAVYDVFSALTYRERYEALVESAGRDGLTGLLNRGRFNEIGEHAVEGIRITGRPLSLLIVDADHFKSVNDQFGHAEGDRVLKTVAALLTRSTSTQGQVFRIGGEEFAILGHFPHTVARLLGENIRQSVDTTFSKRAIPCTVSIGVATADEFTQGLSDLFAVADRRLYAAKAAGRNRVVGQLTEDRRSALGDRRA